MFRLVLIFEFLVDWINVPDSYVLLLCYHAFAFVVVVKNKKRMNEWIRLLIFTIVGNNITRKNQFCYNNP